MLPDWHCDEIPCNLDCNLFNQVVGDVVKLAYDAACADVDKGGCSELTGYITVGEPHNPYGDYIAGWIQGVTPYNPRNSQAGALQLMPRSLMAVGLKLLETGWPMPGDPPDTLPSLEAISAIAQHSNAHAERITRVLYNAVATRQVTATGCRFSGMGAMNPVNPSGGLVGWTWAVQVEVPW